MRIDPTALTAIDSHPREQAQPRRATGNPASVVTLGDAATAAHTVRAETASDARVARLRALLADGDYTVDLDRLASNILEDEIARSGPNGTS